MSTPNPIFDRNFFDKPEAQAKSRMNEVMGGIGLWLLHFTKIGLLAYTSYHGIHAAMMYAGDNPLATIFQIFGFMAVRASRKCRREVDRDACGTNSTGNTTDRNDSSFFVTGFWVRVAFPFFGFRMAEILAHLPFSSSHFRR